MYSAGIVPKCLDGSRVYGGINEQTQQMIKNLEVVLAAANSELSLVIRATVHISDMALWKSVDQFLAGYFGEHKPARTVVPTRELNNEYLIKIDVIAAQRA